MADNQVKLAPYAKPQTLSDIARTHWESAEGDVKKARATAIAAVKANAPLSNEIVAEAVCRALDTFLEDKTRERRRTIISAAVDMRGGVIALANGLTASLLDFPLPGGLKLRDAKPDEVSPAIEYYEKMGADVTRKAKWLRLIVQSVPRDKKIGSVITDERAQELFQEAA